MRTTVKVIGYQLRDVIRSRWLIAYALFFLLATDALLRFGGADAKALLSLANVVLLVIPLVALWAVLFLVRNTDATRAGIVREI